jgi:hypothetical protein
MCAVGGFPPTALPEFLLPLSRRHLVSANSDFVFVTADWHSNFARRATGPRPTASTSRPARSRSQADPHLCGAHRAGPARLTFRGLRHSHKTWRSPIWRPRTRLLPARPHQAHRRFMAVGQKHQ